MCVIILFKVVSKFDVQNMKYTIINMYIYNLFWHNIEKLNYAV